MAEKIRVHVYLSGRVQGVAYRYFAERRASELGLTGWVRNLFDGRVEVLAEGDRADVDQFVSRLKEGPRMGRVEYAEVSFEPYTGEFGGFQITGSW